MAVEKDRGMMAHIEHNLSDIELIEVLEKSLKGAQGVVSNSERLKDQAMIDLADKWKGIFGEQAEKMLDRIKKVLNQTH
jgi:hypothetical protein